MQGYVPGVGYQKMAQDSGLWIPPGSGLAFQAHYTTYGKETTENTKLGLYFYPKGEEPKYLAPDRFRHLRLYSISTRRSRRAKAREQRRKSHYASNSPRTRAGDGLRLHPALP